MYLIRYRYDKNGVYEMSNPNLAPPRTISYELGFAYNFFENMIATLSGYYKDVTGQNGDVNYVIVVFGYLLLRSLSFGLVLFA
jgi:outer membrane receptor protein involved in Fe transport